MSESSQNSWARAHAPMAEIAWAMDLSEKERADLIDSMPSATWTRRDQTRYAAILVVIADREELGLPNDGLRFYADRTLPGLPSTSASRVTLPDILATPIDELVHEVATLTDDVVRLGALHEGDMTRLAVLWIALAILKEPEDDSSQG